MSMYIDGWREREREIRERGYIAFYIELVTILTFTQTVSYTETFSVRLCLSKI